MTAIKKSVNDINELNLKSINANQRSIDEATQALTTLLNIATEIEGIASNLQGAGFQDLAEALQALLNQVTSLPQQIEQVDKTVGVIEAVEELTDVVREQKLDPTISVQPSAINLAPLQKSIQEVKKVISSKPDIKFDTTSLEKMMGKVQTAVDGVKNTIANLRFPTPNYVLPFKNTAGAASQVQLDSSGNLPVSATIDTTGLATSAKQDTQITAEQAIRTAVETIDNAISGSEMQVDVVGSLPAGTNNIGDVDIASALPAGTNAIGKLTQPATPTLANVTMTGSSVTLAASNTARRNLMIFNDSGVTVYVKLGSTASSTSFTIKMADQSYYELPDPVYTGIVTALGASGDVRVSEVV